MSESAPRAARLPERADYRNPPRGRLWMSRSPCRCDLRMQAWHIPPCSMWFGHTAFPHTRHDTAVGAWHRWQSDATTPTKQD